MLYVPRIKTTNIERNQDEYYLTQNFLAYSNCRYYKTSGRAKFIKDKMPNWRSGLKAHYSITLVHYRDHCPLATIFERTRATLKCKQVDGLRNGDLSYFKITEDLGRSSFIVMHDKKVLFKKIYNGTDAFKTLQEFCNEYLESLGPTKMR